MSAPDAKKQKLEIAAPHAEPTASAGSAPTASGSSLSRSRAESTRAACAVASASDMPRAR